MKHKLKTDPESFAAVLSGLKTHEIRFNDRGFKVGDELLLRETIATGAAMLANSLPLEYTGRSILRVISHVQTGYGLESGWAILSLATQYEPGQVERVRDAVAESLGGVYYCGRTWSAWSHGTMCQDDFAPAGTIEEVVDEISAAAIAAMGVAIDAAAANKQILSKMPKKSL